MPLHVQRNGHFYYFQISILNEKNYFDSKHSMQVQCLFSCRCKKRFASMWMQLVFDEVWLYCKYITEHQLFV